MLSEKTKTMTNIAFPASDFYGAGVFKSSSECGRLHMGQMGGGVSGQKTLSIFLSRPFISTTSFLTSFTSSCTPATMTPRSSAPSPGEKKTTTLLTVWRSTRYTGGKITVRTAVRSEAPAKMMVMVALSGYSNTKAKASVQQSQAYH